MQLPDDFPHRLPSAVQLNFCRRCHCNVLVHELAERPWACNRCGCVGYQHVLVDLFVEEWLAKRAAGARPSIGKDMKNAVLARDGMVCRYCKRPVHTRRKGPRKLHIDHVIPWSLGGRHTVDNLVVSCAACNLSKGANPAIVPEEWEASGAA